MYLFFLNSFYRIARDGAKRPPMAPNVGRESCKRAVFRNYPEGRNVFLPSTFNAGLRDGPGFPMSSFRLIGPFLAFPKRTAVPRRRTRDRYIFRANLLEHRMS
jgi:hypothetical protein